MYEEFGSMIARGFSVWKRNLNICIPFLLDVMAIVFLTILLFGFIFGTMPEVFANIERLPPEDIIQALEQREAEIVMAFISFILIASLISAYFTAGATGMARNANATGFSSLGDMWAAGRKHWMSVFLASLLSLMIFAFVVAVVSALFLPFIEMEAIYNLAQNPDQIDPGLLGIVMLWAFALILVVIIISLALAVVSQAIVVDSLGAIAGIRASVRFFRDNIFDVFLLWLVTLGISIAFSILGGLFEGTVLEAVWSMAGVMFSVLVVAPLTTVWWTRLYMGRTGKELYRHDRAYID